MSFDPRRSVTNFPVASYPSTVAFARRGNGSGLIAAAICRAAGAYVGVWAWIPPAAMTSVTTAALTNRNFRPLALIDYTLRRFVRHRLISFEPLHKVASTVRLREKISRIQMELGLGYDGAHTRVTTGNRIGSKNVSATRGKIAKDIAEESIGRRDLDFVERLEQHRFAFRCNSIEGLNAGHLECLLR